MNEPWGYKVSISIYVEGKIDNDANERSFKAVRAAADEFEDGSVAFGGCSIAPVQDEPKDQIAS